MTKRPLFARNGYALHSDGEPNFYTVLKDDFLLMRIQMNGSLTPRQQETIVTQAVIRLSEPFQSTK